MNTETLDKLYLEWSQFTSARTKREHDALRALEMIRDAHEEQDKMDAWDFAVDVLESLKVTVR